MYLLHIGEKKGENQLLRAEIFAELIFKHIKFWILNVCMADLKTDGFVL